MLKQVTGMFQRVGAIQGEMASREDGHATRGRSRFRVGVTGMADIGGWVRDYSDQYPAIPFQIEVKTGSAQQSGRQKAFSNMCQKTGCPYLLINFTSEPDFSSRSPAVQRVLNFMQETRSARTRVTADG